MKRAYNFCAGPAALPEAVLIRAQEEMLSFREQGLSIMEMSHRSAQFVAVAEQAEKDFRALLGVSADYEVLFLQGGASLQFSMIPMNLMGDAKQADYVCTGSWSKKAISEAKRFGRVRIAASGEQTNYTTAPPVTEWDIDPNSAYVHYCPNETIHGVEYLQAPVLSHDLPLIADMSSTILSRPIDVNQFGLIYAGAQKNIGPAGLSLVVIHKTLLERSQQYYPDTMPTMLSYKTHAQNASMYNTPPTYSWYLAGLVFQWLLEHGGLTAMAAKNEAKASKLYRFIDQSDFYQNPVAVDARSWMNIPFILEQPELDSAFLAGAEEQGLLNLKGHRSVGGMRASLYNAVEEAAVDALIAYMSAFEKEQS